jgi:iron complex transport system permease protein
VCNALAAAAIMLANAIVSYTQAQGILFWIMGSLSTQGYQLVAIAAAYALVGVAWIVRHAQDLNLLALGEESALELGVDVERTRRSVFVAASPVVPLAAFLGALGMITLVYLGARAAGRASPHAILLVGVVCNALAPAAIMLANAIVSYTQAQGILFWIMGSLSTQGYGLVAVAAAYALVGVTWIIRHAQDLNLLALGEESALELGVEVERTRRSVFVAASLLVGAAVAVSGMIGFVGLIVPHLLRLGLGSDHRLLVPASFLGGATFLVAADTVARTALAPAELPVGVVTALLGGPFFIWLLRRSLVRALA